jgi:hypothetical protein
MQGSCRCQAWQATTRHLAVKSTTIPCLARDGLPFTAPGGERQKHVSALNGALATGCKTPGLYGKKKIPRSQV